MPLHRVGDRINSASSGRIPKRQVVTSATNGGRGKRHKKVKREDAGELF